MSNTGRDKKLASFNCDESLWQSFKSRCQQKGTTATATLTRFIQLYLDGSLDDLDVNPLDKRLDERVKASVDEYLATRLDSLQSQVTALSEKVAFLEGAEAATQSPRSKTKAVIARKEPEFWFIQQRAKHLGLEISASQRMKVEMWANESYKERHGQVPQKQLYRGTQASVYPAKDVDIVDATIKGVVRGG
ncbi:hypothetical protein [Chlorogloea sp. CCALA 695]|uniref:hypothetical protein n=1 Tax=Chlorogloea sp. CCALA 695 TaxID=2107693 RepID=UPI000D064F9A|nr:hypothetical protein [Chlorogloea sp. CCALA 695]PSB26906.1 hypothetical protein C7B70_23315 [Chlorogloea sp. CCALA 695]